MKIQAYEAFTNAFLVCTAEYEQVTGSPPTHSPTGTPTIDGVGQMTPLVSGVPVNNLSASSGETIYFVMAVNAAEVDSVECGISG